MNGKRNSLSGQLRKLNKRTSKRVTSMPSVLPSIDIGDWRITQDEDGSLILYNFVTGNKVALATQ